MKLANVRDVALLLCGLLLLGHETVIAVQPREALLIIATAMLGLPASLLADRRFVRKPDDTSAPKTITSEDPSTEESPK